MTGRSPSGRALAVPVEPEDVSALSGFDPSRGLLVIAARRAAADHRRIRELEGHIQAAYAALRGALPPRRTEVEMLVCINQAIGILDDAIVPKNKAVDPYALGGGK